MVRLDPEARMTIKTLAARGATNSHIARLLGVTEGAVRPQKIRRHKRVKQHASKEAARAQAFQPAKLSPFRIR